ncbi:MAG: Asp23/Gls24 family envelope stress response protein [Oscillospiraceae bacterium]|nr:Asp23/Gls24 family envelope stress response protein [Oscillospiraceae bacterium]
MGNETKKTTGSVKISEDVLIKIAETAACEIDGVAKINNRLEPPSTLAKFRGPVRVKVNGESAAIKFDISVLEGFNAVSVAESIQKSAKSAVQNMTGFTVTKVDVNVAGVKFLEEKSENGGVTE